LKNILLPDHDEMMNLQEHMNIHIDLAIKMAAMLTISIDLLKLKYVSQNIILNDL
jgi:hypothetical protein